MADIIDRILGRNLPKSGKVEGKGVQEPTKVNYGGIVGEQTINDKPVYFLYIRPAGSKKKPRSVPVTKKEYDTHKVGDHWTATE